MNPIQRPPFPRLLLAVLAIACSGGAYGAEFVPLFDGKSLDGWVQRGGKAKYSVVDGMIVGETVPNTPNSFLCTAKDYGDFVLEYEFKIDEELNSGVQIRSHSKPDYRNGQVHGYQVEIDPDQDPRKHGGVDRPRLWTGGIYEEGRRGWLNDLFENDAARVAFKAGEWNHIRVHAFGDWIRTWVNGVPAADLRDSLEQSGFIALQVHGIGNSQAGPWHVSWRNLKIKDLGRHEWRPVFDGKSLGGWKALPGGEWTVEDGAIVGRSPKSEARHGILLSDKTYGDFALRAKFRVHSGDSGFYFRSDPVGSGVAVNGFQVEVDSSQETGGLYETGGRGWVVKPSEAEIPKKNYRPGEWTDLSLSANGGRVVVQINGVKTAELKNDPGRKKGRIGLQLHGGQDMHVDFKAIEVLVPVSKDAQK